jgi:phosphatidylinositol glycan class N
LTGFYEDPSALLTGWKVNPVRFDSVFNHTAGSWGFGSPDVVPLFQGHGAYGYDSYAAELEDFGLPDLSFLDTWVLDKMPAFLHAAAHTPSHPLSAMKTVCESKRKSVNE